MVNINLDFLKVVLQELVDAVETSPFIIPELLFTICDVPKPTNFAPEFHRDKVEMRIKRRKDISNILHSDSNVMSKIRKYQEKEFMEFIKAFPEFKELVKS